ncbi:MULTISPECIES: acyl-CoA dehydrogenase family protein [unclassified Microbacterium]|uniref:acyl-CoA dehydrogenase family protein n=1 Tax=unclassified Microbacterium TaxID=2609290 RepID=UPI00214BAB46|nr:MULTISPECIES: acyl-CoA dehydrogenase family protein [unclassified Microbacterium]MCR2811328.1 acyl-CoA/acyl-ACP dehydrogenase [Microbacterium sp. zg.B185]WIM19485.1 acyl-CoA dehydrogenase family protein [Microbacterium sp. zg-B185]
MTIFQYDELDDGIAQAVRERCAAFDDAYWSECERTKTYPDAFFDAMAQGGWLGLTIPEEYGGGGQGTRQGAVMLHEIGASGAAEVGCVVTHNPMFAAEPIIKFGSEELKQQFLPALASGEIKIAFSVTEPNAGLDTSKIATSARAVDGGYLLTGQKIYTTQADVADVALVIARTSSADSSSRFSGLSLFLVDYKSAQGIEIRSIEKHGMNAIQTCEVFFDDAFVPSARLIGEEGQGFRYLLDALNRERLVMSAEAIGVGRAALARAVTFAKDRVVFDRPIGANQAISHPLAEAATRLDAAWAYLMAAMSAYDNGVALRTEGNEAYFLAVDAGWQACDAAVQTLGGMGYAREGQVERYAREMRVLRLSPITPHMMLNHIAQAGLGLPRSY